MLKGVYHHDNHYPQPFNCKKYQQESLSLICFFKSSSFSASRLTSMSFLDPVASSEQLWVLEGNCALPLIGIPSTTGVAQVLRSSLWAVRLQDEQFQDLCVWAKCSGDQGVQTKKCFSKYEPACIYHASTFKQRIWFKHIQRYHGLNTCCGGSLLNRPSKPSKGPWESKTLKKWPILEHPKKPWKYVLFTCFLTGNHVPFTDKHVPCTGYTLGYAQSTYFVRTLDVLCTYSGVRCKIIFSLQNH